ncbi:hypothetical protein M3181_24820 [Mesobacillus maritimus]|uniref:hypothetical protein n=1 Tax=Mesobacillus maritimus TaxID=1643336 RepID=UPI00203DA177|nr:hypothetical protein [Mesobacillus maritimus]MCM3672107.1 hypothetical protein [Mesobacillus maritimus]
MLDEIGKNYHSRLLHMSKAFDKPIERLKGGHVDAKYSNWMIWLLLAPLREYTRFIKVHEGLKKLSAESLTALVIPSSAILTTLIQWVIGNINNLVDFVGIVTLGLSVGYLLSLIIYWRSLLDFYSDHFHTGAYKVFRKQEYYMFKIALFDKEGDFYFQGVYDYFGKMQAGRDEFTALSDKVTDYFEKDKKQLETKFTLIQNQYNRLQAKSDEKINKITEMYESLILDYDEILKDASDGAEYVIELIKDINNVLFRMRNEEFTSKDLNLVCGFTLYEQKGKELHKIEDVGASGRTPKVININDPIYKDWGVVEVIKKNLKQPVINEPYENHTVVSVKMNIDRDKQWVYNFHFDMDNKKANHLLVKNDIIDSREVYRLMHALCLIAERLQSSTLKEANKHA